MGTSKKLFGMLLFNVCEVFILKKSFPEFLTTVLEVDGKNESFTSDTNSH